jgi:hypothetical protein
LRKIYGPQQEKVTVDWRKMHTEVLYDLCPSPDIIWVIRSMMMRCVQDMGIFGGEGASIHYFSWKPVGRRPFGKVRHKLEATILIDLKKQDERVWSGLRLLR